MNEGQWLDDNTLLLPSGIVLTGVDLVNYLEGKEDVKTQCEVSEL
jgi:hypothetical protein